MSTDVDGPEPRGAGAGACTRTLTATVVRAVPDDWDVPVTAARAVSG